MSVDYRGALADAADAVSLAAQELRAIALQASEMDDRELVEVAGLRVDANRREVRQGGCMVVVTRTEFDLLLALIRKYGSVVTHEHLLQAIWGDYEGIESRTVPRHLARLRQKLGVAGSPLVINSCRGVGYRLVERP